MMRLGGVGGSGFTIVNALVEEAARLPFTQALPHSQPQPGV